MRKFIQSFIVGFSMAIIFYGCSKSKDSPGPSTPSTPSISLVNQNWWGSFSYAGKDLEYYCMHFLKDSTLTWNQDAGEYPADWSLVENHLTIDFKLLGGIITGDIVNGDHLENLKINTSATINRGELIPKPPPASLDGTTWVGTIQNGDKDPVPMRMIFKLENKVDAAVSGLGEATFKYTRDGSQVSFRSYDGSKQNMFGVIYNDSSMAGSLAIGIGQRWKLTKKP